MSRIAILYATRQGQTAKIAHRLAVTFHADGHVADVLDVGRLAPSFSLGRYDAAVLAASVHAGKHESEMVSFVRDRLSWLARMPTAFLSVSLTEITAEDEHASPAARAKAQVAANEMIERFLVDTGFQPTRAVPVAGALLYTKYGLITRAFMKWISRKNGGPTDTSRNYEYTDWNALARFAGAFSSELERHAEAAACP